TLIWSVGVVIVNPIGDFPLNDDWSFGLAVQYFMQRGSFHPTGWTAMTLLTNVIWGSLFCLPQGFSFTALRFSTLAASWLGVLGAYWLVRKLGQPRSVALLAGFTLAFNPLYFVLSNTFMTDVPCLTLMIFSAIFFLENLKNDSLPALTAAIFLSLAAILSRQVGLAVPLAFALVTIAARGFKARVLGFALAPTILGIAVLAGFQYWMKISGILPKAYTDDSGKLFRTLIQILFHPAEGFPSLVHRVYACLVPTGLFLSPLLLLAGPAFGRSTGKVWAGAGIILLSLAGLLAFYRHAGMSFMVPLAGNNLSVWGLGPLTLRDAFYLSGNPLPLLPRAIYVVATVMGLVGGTLLIYRTCSFLRHVFSRPAFPMNWDYEAQAGVFLLLISVIYMGQTILGALFDRYLVPIIPFLTGFLVLFRSQDELRFKSIRYAMILATILGFSIFSVCGTRDYLAWNRARWEALDNLMSEEQVKPQNIDGGFEFNGFYLYNPGYQNTPGKSRWWVVDDTYLITFKPILGYSILHDYHYTHWMPPYTGNIYVLQRDAAAHPGK
ncbi:MAG TPA: glycosyltransferase family 39 protein, partial [Candidatus Acidoferrum sp.]|nr:glycosyltransferase family 39 protein [Candidatus Acidoferrum sp.]